MFFSDCLKATACAAFLAVGCLPASIAQADTSLPPINVKVIGSNSKSLGAEDERTFWTEILPEASNGQVTASYQPVDHVGLEEKAVLRLLQQGVMDFGTMDVSKLAGDDALFEGCDIAGLTLDLEKARQACEAWAPVLDKALKRDYNAKLLGFEASPPQVVWCSEEVAGLNDLKGRKIRVFNKSMTAFVESVGATPVSIAYAEVVPALQRGVVDCAITGSLSGNIAGWWEVTEYLYPMTFGWAIGVHTVNYDTWERWSPEVREFFETQFEKFEDMRWQTAQQATNEALNCNVGKDPCTLGKKVDMQIVPVSESDRTRHRELMQNAVLVEWASRAGSEQAKAWNGTVGEALSMEIPLDKVE